MRIIGMLGGVAAVIVVLALGRQADGATRAASGPPGAAAMSMPAAQSVPSFFRVDRCYRFTFSVTGSLSWKVREVLDNGWIRTEIDAGPASSAREVVWVNTGQIITAREMRCSD